MGTTITDVLNIWNDVGVFSYVIPFLLIFAVVFAILKKTRLLTGKKGDDSFDENNGILAIISVAISLLSLQFDIVSRFFAIIFPRFGVGLSIFLVLIIFLGFFTDGDVTKGKTSWIGWVVGIGVVLWALSSWDEWNSFGFGYWWTDNFWSIVVVGVVVGIIALVAKPKGSGGTGTE